MYFPDLIDEYKQSLKKLKAAGGCSIMERDMLEAIKWMETGYDPAEYRAATRTDVYVMDHHLMQDLITYVDSEEMTPGVLAEVIDYSYDNSAVKEIERMFNIKDTLNQAMAGLTENERTAFIMIRAEQMTFSKAAKILGVNRGTVQNYVKRAESKIADNISKEKPFLFAV
ncbi:DUF134 domain-containing protein [Lysinibacillus sp. A4]|uniref:sigma factor-like helix-turn-helix DNA-binding protein n=1 Tax=Lysinibacillus sp. A4 TaxID=2976269 RepID=UPI0021759A6A|nr:sigma factor-like helix-turn-helix DNA-binding protein [Lysinibacillus sp. A4]MCS5501288.1 DUF134 domain-containing protein [Lysinibacillus sp. A4]